MLTLVTSVWPPCRLQGSYFGGEGLGLGADTPKEEVTPRDIGILISGGLLGGLLTPQFGGQCHPAGMAASVSRSGP